MNNVPESSTRKNIITHSGNFHTDEVFACAALVLLHGEEGSYITRSREQEDWETADYVVDVGWEYDPSRGRFDHHQQGGAGMRENGIPYSSFGLVWKEVGEKLCGSAYAAGLIDKRIVQPIDAGDNGMKTFSPENGSSPYIIQDAVGAFRRSWCERERTDDHGFHDALEFAKALLKREITRTQHEEEGRNRVEEIYKTTENKQILVLDDHYPWYEVVAAHPEIMYVVKPDRGNDGKWKIETTRDNPHSFKNRKDLPVAWGGKRGIDLAEVSGIPDALFCHSQLFVAVAGSKEGALALAEKALDA